MEDLSFTAFLKNKKIDPKKFYQADQAMFEVWKREFDQMHPNSFAQQKLFLLNKIRRANQLDLSAETEIKKKPAMRPKIAKPKTK